MRILGRETDQLTGLVTTYASDGERFHVNYAQDVSGAIDHTTALRNADDYTRNGIKAGLWHCIHIPDSVALRMRTDHGFDVYAASAREVRQFLVRHRAEYRDLFTTSGKL